MRKVTSAKLHVSAFIGNIGNLGQTLYSKGGVGNTCELDMWYGRNEEGADGLHITAKKGNTTTEVTFPPGTVEMVTYAPRPKAEKAA